MCCGSGGIGTPARWPAGESCTQHFQHCAQRRGLHPVADAQPLAARQHQFQICIRCRPLPYCSSLHQREAHRFLVPQPFAPGVERVFRKSPYRRFKTNSESVTTLRNSIQHLERNFLKTAADTNWAVFGTLTWAIPNVQTRGVRTGSLIPGSIEGAHPASPSISGKKIHLPVGLITLHQGTVEFPISVVMDDVANLARMLEEVMSDAFNQLPHNLGSQHLAADLLIIAGLSPVQE